MRALSNTEGQPKELVIGRVVRRLPIYFGLAFAGLVLITLLMALSIHFGITGYLTGGWIGFVGFTGLLFWIIVRESRSSWHYWSFWFVLAGLLTTHCFTFVAILRVYPQWRMIWFWPITVAEAGVFGGILAWLFPERRTRTGTRSFERARLPGVP